jgi:methyl-accepting chemotaxis protein
VWPSVAIIFGAAFLLDRQEVDSRTAILRVVDPTDGKLRSRTVIGVVLLVIGLAALAAVIAWLSIRRHARSLRLAIDDLANTSEYVASGAAQVAAASRSLAEGAAKQVASVEDIASSSRETSAMASVTAITGGDASRGAAATGGPGGRSRCVASRC